MSDVVRIKVVNQVAVLMIDNPPVNALSHAVRQGLWKAVEAADAAPDVTAIVIAAHGKTFPSGTDISEDGKPSKAPSLPDLINRIEVCSKPVIVGMHGTALGAGFEFALGAHYRLAQNGTRLGLPEVTLGVVPGAGGTQRVPRLAGPAIAVKLMVSGTPFTAEEAASSRLIDGRVDGDVASACLALARKLQTVDIPLRATRDRNEGFLDVMGYFATLEEARDELDTPDLMAPARIIDCVEAALLLPFEIGLNYERAAFEECRDSDESAALRHAFFAERRASALPELRDVKPRPVGSVAVLGAGTMGAGIALSTITADLPVYLYDRDAEALAAGVRRIHDALEGQLEKGKITREARARAIARLRTGLDLDSVPVADLVIEAVPEDLQLKIETMRTLGRIAKPNAILATNTSYLDLNTLAVSSGRPASVVGLHFFSPAHVMRLIEVVIGDETAPDVTAAAFELARRMGKFAVPSGVEDGFIGNQVFSAYRTACDHLLEDGASVAQIDRAMRRFGFKLGPFQVADLAGLDISWARRKRLALTRDPLERYVRIADILCEKGRFGQKVGKGYYTYPDGPRSATEDPEVTAIIAAERAAREIATQQFSDDDIRLRAVLAMVNAGAELVRTGIARRPSDVDVVMLHGYGFPRWQGGPMQWADSQGALAVRMALAKLADQENRAFWSPSPLFDQIVRNGGGFAALNKA